MWKFAASGAAGLGLMIQLDPNVSVVYKNSPVLDRILEKCPSLTEGFHPTPWLFNGILQGLYGMGPGSSENVQGNADFVQYTREFIQLKDSGILSIDWKSPRQNSKKILIVVPGLSGGSHSEYLRTLVNSAYAQGFDVAVIHGRGIAGTPVKTFKVHHLCASDDIAQAIRKVHKSNKDCSLVALGTSMGAGLLLKYLIDSGENCVLKGAVAVAAPFDYKACREKLNNFFPYFGYADGFIVKSLKDQFESVAVHLSTMHEDLKEKNISIERVRNIKSSQEFDEEFTIKMTDYESTEQYYADASVGYNLSRIKVPTLSLNSQDDPIVPFYPETAKNIIENPNILLAYTKIGGHIGFYTGWSPVRWYPKPCLEFLDATLSSS